MSKNHRIFLMGEIPKFGSGWRRIDVLQIGPKWVRLRLAGNGRVARVSHDLWVTLISKSAENNHKNMRVITDEHGDTG